MTIPKATQPHYILEEAWERVVSGEESRSWYRLRIEKYVCSPAEGETSQDWAARRLAELPDWQTALLNAEDPWHRPTYWNVLRIYGDREPKHVATLSEREMNVLQELLYDG